MGGGLLYCIVFIVKQRSASLFTYLSRLLSIGVKYYTSFELVTDRWPMAPIHQYTVYDIGVLPPKL